MGGTIKRLIFIGALFMAPGLQADCTHAPGDCVTTSAWDVVNCPDGTTTIYWCNGDVTVYGGGAGHVQQKSP